MRDHEPSRTAAYVAGLRGLGALLPAETRLSDDPYGLRFSRPFAGVAAAARRFPAAASRALYAGDQVLAMQIRTRVLDDALLGFAAQGGTQVVLLGAGYDCRAARFARELAGVTVLEVDHPATQAEKRRVLAASGGPPSSSSWSAHVVYLAWDFERTPMSALPSRLADLGHDAARPTLTIWEGVTMYLTAPAVDATAEAVRAFSARGSPFAFTYLERAFVERPTLRRKLARAVFLGIGEPFRFGWDPRDVPAFAARHGFTLLADRPDDDLARELFPPHVAAAYKGGFRHVVLTERT